MKKKIIITLTFIILIVIIVYFYAFKAQRNIGSEKAIFELSVIALETEFETNDSLANNKFLDKTIIIYGKITDIDLKTNGIVIDEKVYITVSDQKLDQITSNQDIKIKGRFIGYDDLLEEYRLDQGSIVK